MLAEALVPFTYRLTQLSEDASSLLAHGEVRAGLRARESRPPFSDTQLTAMRSTRDAMTQLLALADPAKDQPPAADPPPAAPANPPAAPADRSNWAALTARQQPKGAVFP
jgi:hypothetical protein